MAMAKKTGLGRGLEALMRDGTAKQPEPSGGVLTVPVTRIKRSALQPRQTFAEAPLRELAGSIREHGILQPLLVREIADGYELIAGERRLRAAGEAGLEEVPIIVTQAPDEAALELALVENLQREDLNALEEAEGYQALGARFGLTQEQIGVKVGKPRATVANALRLLALPEEVKHMLANGNLSAGHAKALSALDIAEEQVLLARRTEKEGLSVRNLEKIVQRTKQVPRKPRVSRSDIPASHLDHLSDRLHTHFATSVRISPCRTYANGKKGKGSVEIDYYSADDLHRILEVLGVVDE
jgi:ParB family transcriptional regulator, chromosome partitioning protein